MGEEINNLLAEDDALWARANTLPTIQLSERAICDLEMLAVGGFWPLDREREDLARLATEELEATILLHQVVGMTSR